MEERAGAIKIMKDTIHLVKHVSMLEKENQELKSLMSVQLDMKAKIEELETQLSSPELMSRFLHESRMAQVEKQLDAEKEKTKKLKEALLCYSYENANGFTAREALKNIEEGDL